ncbi:MAG: hypothetical protein WC358_00150 [Ignavibacteria bacterium]|jgi:hypothetical protein
MSKKDYGKSTTEIILEYNKKEEEIFLKWIEELKQRETDKFFIRKELLKEKVKTCAGRI